MAPNPLIPCATRSPWLTLIAEHGLSGVTAYRVDDRIVRQLKSVGVDFACSVPCTLLAGVLEALNRTDILHVSVTREEEGVGVCAGAALGGRRPTLLMQNSGLGNSINALASLTQSYGLPLFLVLARRGGPGEPVKAQVPMGRATPHLLRSLGIPYRIVRSTTEVREVARLARSAFGTRTVAAVLLDRSLWA